MTWYYYLIAGVALFLIGGVSMMFLPLRIFIRYLRKNRIDQLVVIVRLALCGLRISYTRSAASNRLSLHLLVGTREFAVPWPETADRFLVGSMKEVDGYYYTGQN